MNTPTLVFGKYLTRCLRQTISDDRRHILNATGPRYALETDDLDGLLTGQTNVVVRRIIADASPDDSNASPKVYYLALYPVARYLRADSLHTDHVLSPLMWLTLTPSVSHPDAFTPDRRSLRLNGRLLSDLSGLPTTDERLTRMSNRVRDGILSRADRRWLRRQLDQLIPSVEWQALEKPMEDIGWSALRTSCANRDFDRCYPTIFLESERTSVHENAIVAELSHCIRNVSDNPILARVLGSTDDNRSPLPASWQPATTLTDEQSDVLTKVHAQCITTVAGASGTGKSFLLATAAVSAVAHGMSTLVVAHSTSGRDRLADFVHRLSHGDIPVVRSSGGGELRLLNKLMERRLHNRNTVVSTPHHGAALRSAFQDQRTTSRLLDNVLAKSCGQAPSIQEKFKTLLTTMRGQPIPSLQDLQVQQQRLEEVYQQAFGRHLRTTYERASQDALDQSSKALSEYLASPERDDVHLDGLNVPRDLWSCYLTVCPIWIVDPESLHRMLPFEEGIFDLVVVDEASQLDMATTLPALYRSKRLIAAADNHMRHVHSYLSDADDEVDVPQRSLNEQPIGLSFRDASLWDLICQHQDGRPHTYLTEPYRCVVHAEPSHLENAYSPSKTSESVLEGLCQTSFEWHQTASDGWNGRDNQNEATALLHAVRRLHDRLADVSNPPTIGIVSPFTAQIECIERAAQDILPLFAYERHQLLIATPDAFRGLERDILLCSLGITDDARVQSVRTLDRVDLFNLLMTRAKHRAHFFASFDPLSLPPRHVIRRIHEGYLASKTRLRTPLSHEWMELLNSNGYTVLPERDLMGLQVDGVVSQHGRICGCYWVGTTTHQTPTNLATRLAHARHGRIPVFVFHTNRTDIPAAMRVQQFTLWFAQYSMPSVRLKSLSNSTV